MVQFLNFWSFSSEEVVEHACGMATLQMGEYVSNVSNGIDTYSVREPLGVCAGICPFNFPAMIPLWASHFPTFSIYLYFYWSFLPLRAPEFFSYLLPLYIEEGAEKWSSCILHFHSLENKLSNVYRANYADVSCCSYMWEYLYSKAFWERSR